MQLLDSNQTPIGSKQFEYEQEHQLDPDKRFWEYDDSGIRIYKLECGFGLKTPWDGGYMLWKQKYGHDWEKDGNK